MYYIYRITNKINGKTYIGQHKYKKLNDSYMGSGVLLAKAKKKYGIENFEKEIIYSRIQYKETADSMEIFAIKKERAIGKAEYNIANGGEGGLEGNTWNKGRRPSEETKRKISEALKGRSTSEETRRKLSEVHRGKPKTEEAKRKNSETHKGKTASEETRRKMSEAHRGRIVWNKGLKGHYKTSEETKRKIGAANKGKRKGKHWKLIDNKRVWY